jgi:cytochrome c oxidase subunit 2
MIPSGVSYVRRALAVIGLLGCGEAAANPEPWQLNLTPGVTAISQRIYELHMLGFYVCVGIGILVFGAMFVAMFRFRKSRGAVPEQWSHSTKLEAVWTVAPILLLVLLAWPATKLLVDMANTQDSDMTIKVTGYQWKWRYEYVDYGKKNTGVNFISSLDSDSNRTRQLGSGLDPNKVMDGDYKSYLLNVDKPLVVPTDTKIRFVVTADDVIHAWWVPQLGWKQDAIPGIINSAWTNIPTPGVYRGQCAELCGRDHGFMPIVVKAVPKAEFEQWLAAEQNAEGVNKAAATADATAPTAAAPAAPPQG